METSDYVSYELAVKLKAAGFDEPCRAHYTNDYGNDDPEDLSREVKFHYDWTSPHNYNRVVGCVSAPLLFHAQKWLRNTHKIDLNVDLDDETNDPYTIEIYKDKKCVVGHWKLGFFATYEQALSSGIAAALELIKKGE